MGQTATISAFFNSFDCEEWGLVSDSIAITVTPSGKEQEAEQGIIDVVGTINEDFDDWSAEQLSNAPIAAVEFDAVDMGTMAGSAERVSRTLRITNAGRSALPIRRIYSTAPRLVSIACPVSELAAGESTEVTIDVDVTKIEGTFINESITLITGDPIHPKRTIRLVGLVDRAK